MRTNRLRKLTNLAEITRVDQHGQGIQQDLYPAFGLCAFDPGHQSMKRATRLDLHLIALPEIGSRGREVEHAGSLGTLEGTNFGLWDGHWQVFVAVDTQHTIDRVNPSPIVALAVETGKGIALEQSANDSGSGAAHQLDAMQHRAKGLKRQVMRDVVGGTAFVTGETAHQEPGRHCVLTSSATVSSIVARRLSRSSKYSWIFSRQTSISVLTLARRALRLTLRISRLSDCFM